MGSVERRKKRKMMCVGACGFVTGYLVCVGWYWCVGVCGLVTGVLVCVGW